MSQINVFPRSNSPFKLFPSQFHSAASRSMVLTAPCTHSRHPFPACPAAGSRRKMSAWPGMAGAVKLAKLAAPMLGNSNQSPACMRGSRASLVTRSSSSPLGPSISQLPTARPAPQPRLPFPPPSGSGAGPNTPPTPGENAPKTPSLMKYWVSLSWRSRAARILAARVKAEQTRKCEASTEREVEARAGNWRRAAWTAWTAERIRVVQRRGGQRSLRCTLRPQQGQRLLHCC